MFNNSNYFIGLNNYINGFIFLSRDELSIFATANGLSFSIDELLFIQNYFKNFYFKKLFTF